MSRLRRAVALLVLMVIAPQPAVASTPPEPVFKGVAIDGRYLFGDYPRFIVTQGDRLTLTVHAANVQYRREHLTSTGQWTPMTGWRTLSGTTYAASETFTWTNSDGQYTTARYALRDLSGRPVATTKPQQFRTAKVGYRPPPSTYKMWSLIGTNDRSWPARVNPCQPLTVRADLRGLTRGSEATAIKDIKTALDYLSTQMGIPMTYVGSATSDNTELGALSSADVTIVWGRDLGAEHDHHRGYAQIKTEWPANARFYEIAKGKVVINPRHDTAWTTRQRVLRHELMHTLGAGHSESKGSLMTPFASTITFGDGERILARVLGREAGCF